MSRRMAVAVSRLRLPLVLGVVAVPFVIGWFGPELPPWARAALPLLILVTLIVLLRAGTIRDRPVAVTAPVRGRWSALNSPANRVPSHGVQTYGQAYAIDLVYDPADTPRPRFARWRPLARPARAFPAFGQPVYAVAAGTVVRASGWQRDHWSRNSPLGLLYLIVEGALRELTGAGRVLGNHLVLDLGGGVYALYAHLKRRSITVAPGDRVSEGQVVAACGNSGNSSEPHLHFQLMDHRRATVAAGLPMRFRGVEGGLPRDSATVHFATLHSAASAASAPIKEKSALVDP